jgi:hypothetical protein
MTRALRLLIGVLATLAAAAPARAQPADEPLAAAKFDPAICERQKEDQARREAEGPVHMVATRGDDMANSNW